MAVWVDFIPAHKNSPSVLGVAYTTSVQKAAPSDGENCADASANTPASVRKVGWREMVRIAKRGAISFSHQQIEARAQSPFLTTLLHPW